MPTSDLSPLVGFIAAACLALTVVAVVANLVGLVAVHRGNRGRVHMLAHPLVLLCAGAGVMAFAAAGQWSITHGLLDAAFVPTDIGWRRAAVVSVDPAAAMLDAAGLQRWVAGCIAALVPMSWLAAWRFDPSRERSATVASVAAALAMSLPVLAGCVGVFAVTDTMQGAAASDAVWASWHTLEAAKWAVAGLAAVALMAVTPIVMHAAARGNAVSPRTMQLSTVVLLVGLAAWSTSRFANEDLLRGPMASFDRDADPWHILPESRGLPPIDDPTLQLPIGATCVETVDPRRQQALPLVVRFGGGTHDAAWSPDDDGRERVVVALIDRRTEAEHYQRELRDAKRLGATRIAVLTARHDHEPSLTLGTLESTRPCVMGWIDIDAALQLSYEDGRWTTVAFAASHSLASLRHR